MVKEFLRQKFKNIGPVNREMVRARTRELALVAGRVPPDVAQVDYDQAMHELTGESDPVRQQEILDACPEAKCCEPMPGSISNEEPEPSSEDEHNEGRSKIDQLAIREAGKAARKRMFETGCCTGKSERDQA